MQRSPPSAYNTSRSETDLMQLSEVDTSRPSSLENITRRTKRPRSSDENGDQLGDLKTELINLIQDLVATHNNRMDKLEEHILHIKNQSGNIEATNTEIEKSLNCMSDQLNCLQGKIDTLEKERKDIILHLSDLEGKMEAFDRHLIKTTVEIRNVPKNYSETKESLYSTIAHLATQLNVKLQPVDIRDVARLPSRKENKSSSILVEFANTLTKTCFLKGTKEFNTHNSNDKLSTKQLGMVAPYTPIYISELNTTTTKRLFYQCRRFSKAHGYQFCWVNNGQVRLRKTRDDPYMIVKNEEQLETLLAPLSRDQ